MYIRWNRRKRKKTGWRARAGDYMTAVLVKSVRVDGNPRQKVIKTLGSIGENDLNKVFRRRSFWETSERNLSKLTLSDEMLDKIISSLKKVVPKPTDEEVKKDMEESIRTLNGIHERFNKR